MSKLLCVPYAYVFLCILYVYAYAKDHFVNKDGSKNAGNHCQTCVFHMYLICTSIMYFIRIHICERSSGSKNGAKSDGNHCQNCVFHMYFICISEYFVFIRIYICKRSSGNKDGAKVQVIIVKNQLATNSCTRTYGKHYNYHTE